MNKRWPVLFCLTASWLESAPEAGAQTAGQGVPLQQIQLPVLNTPTAPTQPLGIQTFVPLSEQNFPTNGLAQPLLTNVPNAGIVRTTGAVYQNMFYSVGEGGKYAASEGGLRVEVPDLLRANFSYQSVFRNNMSATNAEIRVGRLYYDLTSLSGSVLYSDNVNWTQTNRQGGVISDVTLRGVAMIQLLDNLRLAASIGVIYFPLRNRVGIEGFTQDTVDARLFLGDSQATRAQLSYDLKAGDWDLLFYDQAKATQALFADRFDVAVGEPYDQEDRAGRYAFADPSRRTASGNQQVRVNEVPQNGHATDNTFLYANNQAGATVSRLLPTDTRLRVGAYRVDYWYLGGSQVLLPNTAQVGFVDLRSERDNLRFKPFATYEIFRYQDRAWEQEAIAGVQGPVTENIKFAGGGGYFVGSQPRQNSAVGFAQLSHDLGPHTTQMFRYRREVTAPVQDIEESYTYELRQGLGPHLNITPFVTYSIFADPLNNGTGTKELRSGALLSSDPSSKTSFNLGGLYSRVQYTTGAPLTWYRWTGQAQVRHRLTETFEGRLTYQYQDRNSTLAGDSFYENLVMLTLTKYFY
jgi:hypothetical protein